jgi:glycosyltransferase involved in cell wall biosynthesis
MPGVLIEAGLAGLPTVSTEVAGASTVIDQGLTGIVVPTGDTSALADAVESIVRDPGRRVAMGQEARERCIREFSLTASVRRWQDLLTEALDAPRRRGRVRRTAR